MEKHSYPKVLICAPQHESKMYCWEQWHKRATSLTYPNYDIYLADNSDTMDNVLLMNKYQGIKAAYTPKRKGVSKNQDFYSRVNDSHKQCIDYAIKHKYDWVLHLETDVIPPFDVIERLLARKRPIIAGTYDIFFGKSRRAMVQLKEGTDRTIRGYGFHDFADENEPLFFDGTVKTVFHAGLGCILIHLDIFRALTFRTVKGITAHTDTLFANDCYQLKKEIVVDTTVMCDHINQSWLSQKDKLDNV